MLRMLNKVGDRLLEAFVPQVTAKAADCGYTRHCTLCRVYNGRKLWHDCTCWSNSNCSPQNCTPKASVCY